jgi:hypothetical protein
VTGVGFPEGRNPLRLNSPCCLFAKLRILAACVAPHGYLSGPALSPLGSIPGSYGPRACRPSVRSAGLQDLVSIRPFHQRASWRTPLCQAWPVGGPGRAAPVPFRASCLTAEEHPSAATAQGHADRLYGRQSYGSMTLRSCDGYGCVLVLSLIPSTRLVAHVTATVTNGV